MKGRLIAAVALSLALAPACRMQEQKPNPNLNKAPIAETIRDAGVKMTDDREKLNALIPVKEQPEQKAAEHADAGIAKGKPPAHSTKEAQDKLGEALRQMDWSEVKPGPRPPRGRRLEEIQKERAKSTQ